MRYIDLRSDSVTQPTQEMRDAMYSTPVVDETYAEDPTVRSLEALAARTTGKEAALFLASGTMGNQAAIMTHTVRGDEMLLASGSYMVMHEVGAAAVLAGVQVRPIDSPKDMLTPQLIAQYGGAAKQGGRNALVCLENALANGRVMPLEQMKVCYEAAHALGFPVHLDGARLFNAATALGVSAADLCRYSDSVMFVISKALCAPMGGLLCGSAAFIEKAKRNRKMLGGEMRQAGLIAACGIIAIETMTKRLWEDHDNAKRLAAGLASIPGVEVDQDRLDINMVFFKTSLPRQRLDTLPGRMLEKGIRIQGPEGGVIRLVTNNDVSSEDVDRVLTALRGLLAP